MRGVKTALLRGMLLGLVALAVPLCIALTDRPASANTELVPAARLGVPYWDLRDGKTTFFLLTNASDFIDLQDTPFSIFGFQIPGPSVHVQFYDKTCAKQNRKVKLSPLDIDQLDLSVAPTSVSLPSKVGFADIDVRFSESAGGLLSRAGVQLNVLMGTIVIVDPANDWVAAYPAASNLGSSADGLGGPIVARNSSGYPLAWNGRYEAFPDAVAIPGFFAEGKGPTPYTIDSVLAIAGLPDGNWDGSNYGEAPGQELLTPSTLTPRILVSTHGHWYDGCENEFSYDIDTHYAIGNLESFFGTLVNRDKGPWHLADPASTCTGTAPLVDEVNGAYVGWAKLQNNMTSTSYCDTDLRGSGGAGGLTPTCGINRARGLVGTNLQTALNSANGNFSADITRLWGLPLTIEEQDNCTDSDGNPLPPTGSGGNCHYNMINGNGETVEFFEVTP